MAAATSPLRETPRGPFDFDIVSDQTPLLTKTSSQERDYASFPPSTQAALVLSPTRVVGFTPSRSQLSSSVQIARIFREQHPSLNGNLRKGPLVSRSMRFPEITSLSSLPPSNPSTPFMTYPGPRGNFVGTDLFQKKVSFWSCCMKEEGVVKTRIQLTCSQMDSFISQIELKEFTDKTLFIACTLRNSRQSDIFKIFCAANRVTPYFSICDNSHCVSSKLFIPSYFKLIKENNTLPEKEAQLMQKIIDRLC